jgi:hypothetical protein
VWYRLTVEWLEDRTLFAADTFATAAPLTFTAFQTAHVSHFLADPGEVDLYRVRLSAGDSVQVAVAAQAAGSGLQARLRVFGPDHTQLAFDGQEGGDPRLTFQAAADGDYFLGVSSAGDDAYDPDTGGGETAGATTGLYALGLRRAVGGLRLPDLTGGSFRLDTATAAYGETVSGTFTLENRGGAPAPGSTVRLVLAPDPGFSQVVPLPVDLAGGQTALAVPGLNAGQAYQSGRFTFTLPATAPAGFPASGPVVLGLQIIPADTPPDAGKFDKVGVYRGSDFETLTLLTPAAAGLADLSQVDSGLNARVTGTLRAPAQVDTYPFTVPAAPGLGRLTAAVTAPAGTLVPRLILTGPAGRVLIQSDGGALVEDLQPGSYTLSVSSLSGAGEYHLTTAFVPAAPPLDPLPVGQGPITVAVADLNGDGVLDLVVTNLDDTVSVLLGNGNGSFRPQVTFAAGLHPYAVVVADLNGDGKPDIATVNVGTVADHGTVSVLLGNGDGTFQPQQTFDVGPYYATALAVGDVNGDGIPDLVTTNFKYPTGLVTVLLGKGDGTFPHQQTFAVGKEADAVAVADLDGDGKPELIVADQFLGEVLVLQNATPAGASSVSFPSQQTFTVGLVPYALTVADVTGDGRPDLLVANRSSKTISVLRNLGGGSFAPQQTFAVGAGSQSVAVADVNHDGVLDLVVANARANTVGVLLGKGDGTFGRQQTFASVSSPNVVAVADVTGDGIPDLLVVNYNQDSVSVLRGNGDGTVQARPIVGASSYPKAIVTADVNGDGKPDLVVADSLSGTVGVLLGNGDGSFQRQQTLAVSHLPYAVAVADVNGDGKADLVVADSGNSFSSPFLDPAAEPGRSVGVLLGNGDGTFQEERTFAAGARPFAVAVADVTGDGIPDLVVANKGYYKHAGNTVSVLPGKGDGTFGPQQAFTVGFYPVSVTVADVNGDGVPDIVTANNGDGTVSVLLGQGHGSFQEQPPLPAGASPYAVAVADVTGDGRPDLVVLDAQGTVRVLRGDGAGTFLDRGTFAVAPNPQHVVVADVNGDGIPDVVTASYGARYNTAYPADTVSVLLGEGGGTFQPERTFPVGFRPYGLAVADLNGDGIPDLVTGSVGDSTLTVLLGKGDGSFVPTTPAGDVGLRNTPQLADLGGDGIPDSVVLDRAGNILFRKGLPGPDHIFAPPVIINPGRPARDLTLVNTGAGWAVAAADARFDPALSSANRFVYAVSLYTLAPDGSVVRGTVYADSRLPTRVAAGDLTGSGRDDLVVANALDGSVTIAYQVAPGVFAAAAQVPVGLAPSDLALADVDGDGHPDVVVSDQAGGVVTVLYTDGTRSPPRQARFRADPGLSGIVSGAAGLAAGSLAQSVSLAAGDFTGDGRNDLVVVNRGSHSLAVLANDGGGFTDPRPALITSTSDGTEVNDRPGAVVVGDFNGDGRLDLAVLMEDRGEVWVYTGDGRGHFAHTFAIPVGDSATGLSAVPGGGPGLLDLLVGNEFGDVLRLVGQGDGTFRRAGNRVALAVQDLGTGWPDALVANQQADHVSVQAPSPAGPQFIPVQTLAAGPATQLAPGAVQWARLDRGSPFFDAVVVGSGSNDVLVYRGTGFDAAGRPTFAPPQTYFVGTAPAGVTIQDVNGDGVPDLLVPDQGSNDVAVMFGALDASGHWVGMPGPRLKSGGSGPVAVTVRDQTGDGVPDLVVTNGGSGDFAILPGVGQGFFNDQSPQLLAIPGTPVIGPPSFFGPSGRGVVPMAAGDLVGFDLDHFAATVTTAFAPPAGEEVRAVQALPDGRLVVAEQGGTVALLGPEPGSALYTPLAELAPLTGVPDEPSALAVLENGDEALVTSAGEDHLFVFGLGQGGPAPPGAPEAPAISLASPPAAPVPEATAPGEAPLVLVIKVVTGTLPAGESGSAAPALGSPVPAEAEGRAEVEAPSVDQPGGDDEVDLPTGDASPTEEGDAGPVFEELLPQLHLYRGTETEAPDGPMSQAPPAGGIAKADKVLNALGDAAGDEWSTVLASLPLAPSADASPSRAVAEQREAAPILGWVETLPAAAGVLPLTTSPAANGGGPVLTLARGADLPATGVPSLLPRWDADDVLLAALGVACLASWVESRSGRRTGEQVADDPGRAPSR